MESEKDLLAEAMKNNDPRPLTRLSVEELEKLRIAEEILEARHAAEKRANRLVSLGAILVGYVALASLLANAYQTYLNKEMVTEQSDREQERWKQEFERGRRADKYKAFVDTSNMVTDPQGHDRRVIGLALLDEFVADPDYHDKAVAILEQALVRELKLSEEEPNVRGLSDNRRTAITEIVRAMSATPSCFDLERAADSVGGVVSHAKKGDDPMENLELLTMYARRLVGRAAVICKTPAEFLQVRNPVRDAVMSVGGIGDLAKDASRSDAAAQVARLLSTTCVREVEEYGGHECTDIRSHYLQLCKQLRKETRWEKEKPSCDVVEKWPASDDAPVAAANSE